MGYRPGSRVGQVNCVLAAHQGIKPKVRMLLWERCGSEFLKHSSPVAGFLHVFPFHPPPRLW